jgi:hypothetical protein
MSRTNARGQGARAKLSDAGALGVLPRGTGAAGETAGTRGGDAAITCAAHVKGSCRCVCVVWSGVVDSRALRIRRLRLVGGRCPLESEPPDLALDSTVGHRRDNKTREEGVSGIRHALRAVVVRCPHCVFLLFAAVATALAIRSAAGQARRVDRRNDTAGDHAAPADRDVSRDVALPLRSRSTRASVATLMRHRASAQWS